MLGGMATRKTTRSPALASRTLARFDALELGICLAVNRAARQTSIRYFFATISRLGDGLFWYLLMLILPVLYGYGGLKVSLQMASFGLIGLVIYKTLKSRLVRERPFVSDTGIVCGTPPLDRYSFPSGHTLHAVLFTSMAVSAYPELAPVLIPFAALVALSRVILGLHYPSDVVVGAAIGLGLAQLASGLSGTPHIPGLG
jgi:undecaprenyl-diphosphatase